MSSGENKDVMQSWRSGGHLARMTHCLDSGFMADCTFLLKDQQGEEVRIPAHRMPLSLASPVLEAMLSETWRAQEKREIRIEGVTAECFRLLLGYVYTGQTPDLDMDSALELLATAHMYLVSDLVEACVKHITASLSAEKVCQVLEVASTLSLDGLHSITLQYLVENTSAVLCAASFPECSAATLRLILEQDSLSLSSELELVQACLRWGQHQLQHTAEEQMGSAAPLTVRAALGDLVFLLRLSGLSSEQLARHVVPSGLLSAEEMNAVLCCLATKGDSPMPGGFTDKIRTYLKISKVGCEGAAELHAAIKEGEIQTVRHFLDAGVSVESTTVVNGNTPLLLAAWYGHVEMVRLLLDRGAKLEVTGGGWMVTPLYYAVCKGHTDVVKLLIERGSRVNIANRQGVTPLIKGVVKGYLEIVRVLLEAGANHKITNKEGDAPLHLAIENGNLDIVRALLEGGADPKATNKKGQTVLLCAALKGGPNIVQLMDSLRQYS